ncbi:hypothetical protein KJ590_02710, partial [Patescibacteria group bacterium]|nr:hypothetical protein [Patescibacteria group bacterium]
MSDNLYNKQDWNRFILENNGSFLQSWEWGEFQEGFGKRVLRFKVAGPPSSAGADFGEAMQAQFIANKLPGVNKFYWHCPRGPVTANSEEQIANSELQGIIDIIKKSAGKEVIFFRLGPEATIEQLPIGQLNNSGF